MYFFFRYELGVLRLGADQSTVVVTNTSVSHNQLLNLSLWSSQPRLHVGDGFVGCILEGATVELSSPSAAYKDVVWDTCPLPLGRDCCKFIKLSEIIVFPKHI